MKNPNGKRKKDKKYFSISINGYLPSIKVTWEKNINNFQHKLRIVN